VAKWRLVPERFWTRFGISAGYRAEISSSNFGSLIAGSVITTQAAELVAAGQDALFGARAPDVPGAASIAALINPQNPAAQSYAEELQLAANSLRLKLHILTASNERDLDATFMTLKERRIDALLMVTDPFVENRRDQHVALAGRYSIPTIYAWREDALAGGLISYGTSIQGLYRQAGVYTGKILKGARPAELPVERATKVELVINLKTAKALGLTVPQSLLARADEVIE
jgi:ABC-type uncharacterized transport system substrate-binding protein